MMRVFYGKAKQKEKPLAQILDTTSVACTILNEIQYLVDLISREFSTQGPGTEIYWVWGLIVCAKVLLKTVAPKDAASGICKSWPHSIDLQAY